MNANIPAIRSPLTCPRVSAIVVFLLLAISCATAPSTAPVQPAAPAAEAAPVLPQPVAGAITGRVIDAGTQKPLTEYRLSVSQPDRAAAVTAVRDRNGIFSIAPAPIGTVTIVAEAPGYLPTTVTAVREEGKITQPVEIRLEHGRQVQGTVTSSAGGPLADVEVTYPIFDPMPTQRDVTIRTDAAGKFTITTRPGDLTLELKKSGFVPEKRSVNVADKDQTLNITMMPATSITGSVVDDTGASVAQARVRAVATQPVSDVQDTTTDDQGNFRFQVLRPIEYKFEATKRAHVTASVPVTLPAAEPLTIKMSRGATVRGRVRESSSEERAFVVVYVGPLTTGINNNEEFGLLGVPPGENRVYAEYQAAGLVHRSDVKTIRTTPAGETRVEVRFRDTPVVTGHVLEEGEKPVERALITLRPEDPQVPTVTTVTDEKGAFRLVGLKAGRYSAEVRDRAMISATSTLVIPSTGSFEIVVGPAPKRDLLDHAMPPPPTTPN